MIFLIIALIYQVYSLFCDGGNGSGSLLHLDINESLGDKQLVKKRWGDIFEGRLKVFGNI